MHPSAIACQNGRRRDRCTTGGRPGDLNFLRCSRSNRCVSLLIITSRQEVLRRSVESTQFTSSDFIGILEANKIRISMDGKGCWRDNVFVERLWKSIKYENVYLHAYEGVLQAKAGIGKYLAFYNEQRPHSSLDGRTPDDVYFGSSSVLARAA